MQFLGGEEEARRGSTNGESADNREDNGPSLPRSSSSLLDDNKKETHHQQQQQQIEDPSSLSSSPPNTLEGCHSFMDHSQTHPHQLVNQRVKQHRYSLQVEKVPVALRSNTALFNYFNEMFPNQVHSVCVAMNVPDLEALSVRRQRVARRLEKSLAYYYATGTRPTHVTGRPRFQCCGIESTPIDGMCLVCCCFYNSLQQYDETVPPEHITDQLPDKGECVDSISYYTLDLALCNIRMKKMQCEKFQIAETGLSIEPADEETKVEQWYKPLQWAKDGASKAADSIREEFEVVTEEDEWFQEKKFKAYGSTLMEKRAPLVHEDHYVDLDAKVSAEVGSHDADTSSIVRRRLRKPYLWMRALLWRMGLDFLAAGLDEVQDRTSEYICVMTFRL